MELQTNGEIIIEEGVTTIGRYAFGNSGISKLTIPNSVTSIGDFAFKSCSSLEELTIPAQFNICVFSECTTMKKVTFTGNGPMKDYSTSNSSNPIYKSKETNIEIVIEEGVTSIGKYAFYNCTGIKKITIPLTVISIGNYAFSGVNSNLEVKYNGTSEQWGKITIGSNNSVLNK